VKITSLWWSKKSWHKEIRVEKIISIPPNGINYLQEMKVKIIVLLSNEISFIRLAKV